MRESRSNRPTIIESGIDVILAAKRREWEDAIHEHLMSFLSSSFHPTLTITLKKSIFPSAVDSSKFAQF
jgi:hypothetical protein